MLRRQLEPAVIVTLRVPIPVEVVPELGMLTNLSGKGVSNLLCRGRMRLVARNVAGDVDGLCQGVP